MELIFKLRFMHNSHIRSFHPRFDLKLEGDLSGMLLFFPVLGGIEHLYSNSRFINNLGMPIKSLQNFSKFLFEGALHLSHQSKHRISAEMSTGQHRELNNLGEYIQE
jgi:hypothetical protein